MTKPTLVPDPNNANRGTVRGLGQVERSLQQYGAGRSILASADGVILAGNKTFDRAMELGIPVQEIESDGKTLFVIKRTDLAYDDPRAKELAIADNRASETGLEWDAEVLQSFMDDGVDLDQFWFPDELNAIWEDAADDFLAEHDGDDTDYDEAPAEPVQNATLAERFVVPPFSVLDARQGYWQERKRSWLALGIRSELGRGENALGFSEGVNQRHDNGSGPYAKSSTGNGPARSFDNGVGLGSGMVEQMVGDRKQRNVEGVLFKSDSGRDPSYYKQKKAVEAKLGRELTTEEFQRDYYVNSYEDGLSGTGTSVFDPVLCELAYRWFSPEGGRVYDPFAGGSVRGITASILGREYVGIDLSAPQIAANKEQAAEITPGKEPRWITGDSLDVDELLDDADPFDFVFSCPPYADLEVYSDDPRDLSTMDYDEFVDVYRQIIAKAVDRLADNRFACFVVGDVRDRKGMYRNFVSHTIQAFEDAGARLYNEAILVTSVGSLPIRVGRQFEAGRKLGKTHQNVLVFVKGDPKKATEAIGPVDVADVFEEVAGE